MSKYRVKEDVEKYNWKTGEIVAIQGDVQSDKLELVADETPNQHALVVVDSLPIFSKAHYG